jgi:hypothetical protein
MFSAMQCVEESGTLHLQNTDFSVFLKQGKKACLLLQSEKIQNFLRCDVFVEEAVGTEAHVDVYAEIDVIPFYAY